MMTSLEIIAITALCLQVVLVAIAVIVFAWKVPSKNDLADLRSDMNERFNRIEKRLDALNQKFIDHLKDHP